MDDFDKIISFESLYKAHRRARLSKRHKKEVILFENNLSENLWSLHYDLKYNRYRVGGYHSFIIRDPKEREIQAIGYRDRVLQHSLCDNYLSPLLNKHLIYDNAACRKNKGTSFTIERLKKFMAEHYKKFGKTGYFVKMDVSKYFPSIDHKILKEKLEKVVDNYKIIELLFSIIDSYNVEKAKGLPMGNQTSQCFALLYLDSVDRLAKEKLRIKHYIRYMDDIVFLVENKEIAKSCFEKMFLEISNCNLVVNPKSQIRMVKNGITFLGWRFYFLDTGKIVQKLCQATRKRILKKIKKSLFCVRAKRMGKSKINAIKVSYEGYLTNGNAYEFVNVITKKLTLNR